MHNNGISYRRLEAVLKCSAAMHSNSLPLYTVAERQYAGQPVCPKSISHDRNTHVLQYLTPAASACTECMGTVQIAVLLS